MKRIAFLLVSLVLLLSSAATAFAASPPVVYSSLPTDGVPAESSVGSAEGSRLMATDDLSIHLITWRNSIEQIDTNELKLYGMTVTDWLADKVETDYYLQKWNGSSWVTYSTSYNYVYDSDYLSLSIYRFVAHGYYYRLKTVHKGWLGSTYDERTLYSSYIYVS